jgi:hypothetical protein
VRFFNVAAVASLRLIAAIAEPQVAVTAETSESASPGWVGSYHGYKVIPESPGSLWEAFKKRGRRPDVVGAGLYIGNVRRIEIAEAPLK